MSKSYILKNVRVVDPNRNIDEVMDLGIENGVMADPAALEDAEIIDLSGKIAAPGFIDIHVHLRQPGNTAAETIAIASMRVERGNISPTVRGMLVASGSFGWAAFSEIGIRVSGVSVPFAISSNTI